jgi:lactoylglutathione lyase
MKTRLVGINHVALEVGDIDEALAFYGQFFELSLRGRSLGAAFIDIGDQFLALMAGPTGPPDRARHFGLVVDDKQATREALDAAGYDEVQFTKPEGVLSGMGLDLGKTEQALAELREKGLA